MKKGWKITEQHGEFIPGQPVVGLIIEKLPDGTNMLKIVGDQPFSKGMMNEFQKILGDKAKFEMTATLAKETLGDKLRRGDKKITLD